MMHANIMAVCFIERELLPIEVSLREYELSIFLLIMWPWPDDLHIRTWPVFFRDILDNAKQLPTSSLSKVWQTYRRTDRQIRLIYHAASQVVN